MIHIANAPCSWGIIENTPGTREGYAQFLDELKETGYIGTELGDWGFMPTNPTQLKTELDARQLALIASWVTVRLYDANYHDAGIDAAVRTARLLAKVGGADCILIIGDDHSTVPTRHDNTGRTKAEHSLSSAGWDVYVAGAMQVAEAVRRETGLRAVIHHHGATYIETPQEIEIFLNRTDPELIGLCFDTGHYVLGGGDPVAGIRQYAGRIWHVHFKDFDPAILAQAEVNGWGYQQLIAQGMFSALGTGIVDFPATLAALKSINYDGWIVVEQDVWPGLGDPKQNAAQNRTYLQGIGL